MCGSAYLPEVKIYTFIYASNMFICIDVHRTKTTHFACRTVLFNIEKSVFDVEKSTKEEKTRAKYTARNKTAQRKLRFPEKKKDG